jgi:ABC-2 type transport system permease protein
VWRLQRGAFAGWAVALVMFGLIFGNLTEQIQGLEGNAKDWWIEAGGTDLIVDAYQVSIIQMAGMFVAVYVVQVLLRMRVDETGGTLEPVLATGVSRARWLGSHVANAALGAVGLMVLFAVSMGLTTGQVLGDTTDHVAELVRAGLVQVPGVLVVGAAVVAVGCVVPRWSVPVAWALVLAMIVVGPMFGPSLGLPTWVQDLSPFTHSPKAPAVAVTAAPLLALTGVGVALALAGLTALRRRNLVLPA